MIFAESIVFPTFRAQNDVMLHLRMLWEYLQRLLRRRPAEPTDPYAGKLAPVRKGPPGRSGAVAVAEPEE